LQAIVQLEYIKKSLRRAMGGFLTSLRSVKIHHGNQVSSDKDRILKLIWTMQLGWKLFIHIIHCRAMWRFQSCR